MDKHTTRTLAAINTAFYSDAASAAEFDARRRRPWQGWKRPLPLLRELRKHARDRPLRVLDLGCGNGRFAAFLAEAGFAPVDYLGVDSSEPLLARARSLAFPGVDVATRRADLIGAPWPALPTADLVACFGFFHHVPGRAGRAARVADLARCVAPGGLAVVAFWDLRASPSVRTAPWSAAPDVETRALEPEDTLVRWGVDGRVRYCAAITADEVCALTAGSGLERVAGFEADAGNRYVVLRAP